MANSDLKKGVINLGTVKPRTDPFGMPIMQNNPPSQNTVVKGGAVPIGSQKGTKVTDVTPKTENNQIEILQRDLKSLKGAFYKNNFPTSQKFTKSTQFTNTLMLPVYATAPAVCQQGEVYVNSASGKLYVCSATNTWSLVGTQS
jgi:hypothetical protein